MTRYSCSRTGQTSALLQLFQNWPNQCPVTVVPEVAKPVACLISSDSEPGPDHPIRTEEGKMSPSVLQMAHHLRSSLSGLLISLTSRLHSHRPNIDRTGRSFTRKTLPPPHPTPPHPTPTLTPPPFPPRSAPTSLAHKATKHFIKMQRNSKRAVPRRRNPGEKTCSEFDIA